MYRLPRNRIPSLVREILAEAPASASPVAPVRTRIGPFELVGRLGGGSTGTVYRAIDTRLDRVVALKVLDRFPAGADADPEPLTRFRLEAQSLARLGRHPNLVAVHELDRIDGLWCLAMEHVEGGTLRRWLRERPRTPAEVAEVVHSVALGVGHAHEHGLVHRDLKPENILVGVDGVPRVVDFGLVRDLSESRGPTREGQVLGTLKYMSPEQAAGRRAEVGPWSDVYALGAILYEGLTGALPFDAEGLFQLVASLMRDDPPPPSRRNPSIAADLEAIVMRCLARDPRRRPADGRALAAELARWIENNATAPPPAEALAEPEAPARDVRRDADDLDRMMAWLLERYHATETSIRAGDDFQTHYDLAILYALLSSGRTHPEVNPVKVDARFAGQCRDRAFEHLARAVELEWMGPVSRGLPFWMSAGFLEKVSALRPLRDDPRWKAILESIHG